MAGRFWVRSMLPRGALLAGLRTRAFARPGLLALLLAASPSMALADAAEGPALRLTDMTFVSSQGSEPQVLLEAATAEIPVDSDVAHLRTVRAKVSGDSAEGGMEMSCDRAQYHVDTNDFVAEGHVRGRTGDGRRFETSRLRYDHAKSVAVSDAPVTITDRQGRYRGAGFRYHVGEGRFQLVGDVSVIQQ